jgi:FkbM family methyltransferase
MCEQFLKPTDAVLELGGAIGFIGLFCQKKLGIKKFISVEANPLTVEILKKNYELNNLTPTVWNCALAKEDGKVQLNVGGDFWENYVSQTNEKSRINTIEVPAASIDTLFFKAGHPIQALIIDIEGAEACIDFRKLPSSVEKIIMEIHPNVLGQETAYDLVSTIIGTGFRVARQDGDTFAFLRKSTT